MRGQLSTLKNYKKNILEQVIPWFDVIDLIDQLHRIQKQEVKISVTRTSVGDISPDDDNVFHADLRIEFFRGGMYQDKYDSLEIQLNYLIYDGDVHTCCAPYIEMKYFVKLLALLRFHFDKIKNMDDFLERKSALYKKDIPRMVISVPPEMRWNAGKVSPKPVSELIIQRKHYSTEDLRFNSDHKV